MVMVGLFISRPLRVRFENVLIAENNKMCTQKVYAMLRPGFNFETFKN